MVDLVREEEDAGGMEVVVDSLICADSDVISSTTKVNPVKVYIYTNTNSFVLYIIMQMYILLILVILFFR